MLERAATLLNFLVGTCGTATLFLFIALSIIILANQHRYDPWDMAFSRILTLAVVTFPILLCSGGWLYIAGWFS